jgi:hypothetical protein
MYEDDSHHDLLGSGQLYTTPPASHSRRVLEDRRSSAACGASAAPSWPVVATVVFAVIRTLLVNLDATAETSTA